MRKIAILAATAVVCAVAAIDPVPTSMRFATVSIQQKHSNDDGYSAKIEAKPGQDVTLILRNVSLKFCVQQAYSVKEYQVSGPGWIKDVRYDIVATLAPGAGPEQVWPALQTLLAERWKLSLRRETKEVPIYALTIAEDGPTLRASSGSGPAVLGFQPVSPYRALPRIGDNTSGTLQGNRTIAELCGNLSKVVNRPVLDRTGISGTFDLEVSYGRRSGANAPSIFKALQQQLGLKLQADQAAIEMLIVESAVKKPVLF